MNLARTGRKTSKGKRTGHELDLADIAVYPTATRKGIVWARPIQAPNPRSKRSKVVGKCGVCDRQRRCKRAVRNRDFIGCERALESEML